MIYVGCDRKPEPCIPVTQFKRRTFGLLPTPLTTPHGCHLVSASCTPVCTHHGSLDLPCTPHPHHRSLLYPEPWTSFILGPVQTFPILSVSFVLIQLCYISSPQDFFSPTTLAIPFLDMHIPSRMHACLHQKACPGIFIAALLVGTSNQKRCKRPSGWSRSAVVCLHNGLRQDSENWRSTA